MTASDQITNHIKALPDWRGILLARMRKLILSVDPSMVEEWKWGTPVWSHNGNVVAAGAFANKLKVNFFKGASLPDPHHLFNAGLDAKLSRSIDIGPNDAVDETALRELVRAAVALNAPAAKSAKPPAKPAKPKPAASRKPARK